MAALGYQTPTIRFLCGGTLITQKHVVSAGEKKLLLRSASGCRELMMGLDKIITE